MDGVICPLVLLVIFGRGGGGGGRRDASINMYSRMNCTGYFAKFRRKKRGLVVCNSFLGSTFSSVNLYDEVSLSSIMFFKKISSANISISTWIIRAVGHECKQLSSLGVNALGLPDNWF